MTTSLGSAGLGSGAGFGGVAFGGVGFAAVEGLTGTGFTDFFFCGCSGTPDGLACIGCFPAAGFLSLVWDCRLVFAAFFQREGFRYLPQPDGSDGCGIDPCPLMCILSVLDEITLQGSIRHCRKRSEVLFLRFCRNAGNIIFIIPQSRWDVKQFPKKTDKNIQNV